MIRVEKLVIGAQTSPPSWPRVSPGEDRGVMSVLFFRFSAPGLGENQVSVSIVPGELSSALAEGRDWGRRVCLRPLDIVSL